MRSTTERQFEEHYASIIIQNWWRAKKLRLVYVEMRKQILKIQAHCRGHLARIVYRELKQRERLKQRHAEIVIERKSASIKIQSYWRMYFARKGMIQFFGPRRPVRSYPPQSFDGSVLAGEPYWMKGRNSNSE